MTFGDRIKQLRATQGLSQRELARRVNEILGVQTEAAMTARYIYRIERNKAMPSIKFLQALAQVLNTDVPELFRQEGDQEVPLSELSDILPDDLKEFFEKRRSRGDAEPIVLLARDVDRRNLKPEEEAELFSMLRVLVANWPSSSSNP